MTEKEDEIVVFRHFDNGIVANIAKTKLDAYGIPCFLTEENMAGLYPGQSFFAFSVRLHIFSSDQERAEQILQDEPLSVTENALSCPRCHSTDIGRSFPKEKADTLPYLLFGIFMPEKKVNVCGNCGLEF